MWHSCLFVHINLYSCIQIELAWLSCEGRLPAFTVLFPWFILIMLLLLLLLGFFSIDKQTAAWRTSCVSLRTFHVVCCCFSWNMRSKESNMRVCPVRGGTCTHTKEKHKNTHMRVQTVQHARAETERKVSFLKCIFMYVYIRILKSDLIIWPVIYMGPFSREQLPMTPAHFRSSNDNSCIRCHRPAGQWRLLALTPGGHQKAFGNRMHWQWTITVCLCFTLVAGIPLTFSGWESTFSEGFFYSSLFVFRCMASQRSRLGIECSDLWRRLR